MLGRCQLLLVVGLVVVAVGLRFPNPLLSYMTRFCYNSISPGMQSQCVMCSYVNFPQTTQQCTGSSALSSNVTSTQAFCIISACLQQVRQTPVFIGRRRRRSSTGVLSEHWVDVIFEDESS